MPQVITSALSAIFDDFRETVTNTGKLCDLKPLAAPNGVKPDFNLEMVQQFYLLKYLPSLILESFCMFNDLMCDKHFRYPARVLSIGNGSGLDYYGIDMAMRFNGMSTSDYVFYTALDTKRWKYVNALENPDHHYVANDWAPISCLDALPGKAPTIYIFPKSVKFLSDSEFDKLISMIRSSTFKHRQIFVMFSFNKNEMESDLLRMQSILDSLKSTAGYEVVSFYTSDAACTDNVLLDSIVGSRLYTQEIQDYLLLFLKNCNVYAENGVCEEKCVRLENYARPILDTSDHRYNIYKLKK